MIILSYFCLSEFPRSLFFTLFLCLLSDTFVIFCMALKKRKYFSTFLAGNFSKKAFSNMKQLVYKKIYEKMNNMYWVFLNYLLTSFTITRRSVKNSTNMEKFHEQKKFLKNGKVSITWKKLNRLRLATTHSTN